MHIIARRQPRHLVWPSAGLRTGSVYPQARRRPMFRSVLKPWCGATAAPGPSAMAMLVPLASTPPVPLASASQAQCAATACCDDTGRDVRVLIPIFIALCNVGHLMQCAQMLLSLSERHRESERTGGTRTTSHRMLLPHQQSPDRQKLRIRGSDSASSGLTDTSMRQQAMPAWQTTCGAPPSAPRQLVPPGPALQDQGASTYSSHE